MNLPAQIDRWPKLWRERYEERAGIIEFQANVSRGTAEIRAEQDVRKLAAEERSPSATVQPNSSSSSSAADSPTPSTCGATMHSCAPSPENTG